MSRHLSVVGLVAVTLLTGCAGIGGDDDGGGDKAEKKAPSTKPSKPKDAGGIAVTAGIDTQDRFRLNVDSLRREGSFLTLNGTIRCVKPEESGQDCSLLSTFSADGDHNNFSGFRMLDSGGGRSYAVVRDGDDKTYTSIAEPSLVKGKSTRFWVRFAAPPADVSELDVLVPAGGPRVASVPITSGGVDTSPAPAGVAAATPDEFEQPPESNDAAGLKLGDSDLTAKVTSKAANTIEKRGRREITLAADVLFDFNKATLDAAGTKEVERVAAEAGDRADGTIKVDGYTDSKGSDSYNLKLSRKRADTVRKALVPSLGDNPISAAGRGEADPVAPNTKGGSDNPAGRKRNRRVTVGYTVKRPPAATAKPPAADPDEAASEDREWEYTNSSDGATTYRVAVRGVQRAGNLAVLAMDLTCVKSDSDDCDGQFGLAADASVLERNGGNQNRISGVQLVDTEAQATYDPAFDATNDQLTTETNFAVGATQRVYAYYLAPPTSVDAMTVQIPNGGPRISGVPVS